MANTLLIEGSFEELSEELAVYIDGLSQSSLQSEIAPLLKEGNKVDALKKIVTASSALNSAPEREFVAAYNLLVHLVHQSGSPNIFLPKLCQNVSAPITSSPYNGTGLALNVLSTIFNTLSPEQDSRYHVLLAILKIVRNNSTFDQLTPQLAQLESWLQEWDMDAADQRKLYLAVSDVATEASEDEQAYQYLLKALRTIQSQADASSEDAKALSIRALKQALVSPSHFDFHDLTQLDSIQALRNSEPVWFELLEIFNAQQLDDFRDFNEANPDFIAKADMDATALERK
ncbi:eukaryotic translation initiation factor 3 subunit M, partial [Aureobasidium melanogenum]